MAARRCVMATRAPETVGFPALLDGAVRMAHFYLKPEYEMFARGYAVGLDEYMARLHLGEREGEEGKVYVFEAFGTSAEMAVHEVARVALMYLRYEVQELWGEPYTFVPMLGPGAHDVPFVVSPPPGTSLQEKRMAEIIAAYEWAYRSTRAELDETRRRLLHFQSSVELKARVNRAPRSLLRELPRDPPQVVAAPSDRFPLVVGTWAEARVRRNAISMGLHLNDFPCVPASRETLLGAPEPLFP
ncbi:unnamed protein product [Urochloa humidicola]